MKPFIFFTALLAFLVCTTIGMAIPFLYLANSTHKIYSTLNSSTMKPAATTMEVSSTAFGSEGNIPSKYTCEGDNVNPSITIRKIPENAKSLVLILDDPDAPNGGFTHWVMFNIPVSVETIIEEKSAPGTEGNNSTGKKGYTGPCPPSGTHHYHFKVLALDIKLDLKAGADKKMVEQAMETHVLATGELVALYKKIK